MVIYRSLEEIQPIKDCVVSIGSFDGIHLGHQSILNKITSIANGVFPTVIITFNPHPQTVLNVSKRKELLTGLDKKLDLIEQFGIQYCIIVPFSVEIANISAEEFLSDIIIQKFNPKNIVIGYDHHFGHNRKGNYELLKSLEARYGFTSSLVGPFTLEGQIINSSIIRENLRNNEIESANKYLGWEYEIEGVVVPGSGRGTDITFPTANIELENKDQLIPGNGSYCISANIQGLNVNGMCNIGLRPTFNDTPSMIIEVNLFHNFEGNLYGKKLNLKFLKYLRPEKKFKSTDELIQQLERDKENCKDFLEV